MRICSLFLSLCLLLCIFPAALAKQTEIVPAEVFQAPKQIVITFAGDCTLGCTPHSRDGRRSEQIP